MDELKEFMRKNPLFCGYEKCGRKIEAGEFYYVEKNQKLYHNETCLMQDIFLDNPDPSISVRDISRVTQYEAIMLKKAGKVKDIEGLVN